MITAPPLCKAHFTRGNDMVKTSESVTTAEGVRLAPQRKCFCGSWHSAAVNDKPGFRRCLSCGKVFNAEVLREVPPPEPERRVKVTRHDPARVRRCDTVLGWLSAHGVPVPPPREMAVPNIKRK